ncbi:hypothetical protein R70199_07857 [Paraburkholderia domus]|nr:hypothetical protein R70199_07857 [Paraburkholderia domus]
MTALTVGLDAGEKKNPEHTKWATCPECDGRRFYDDPPWGIVPCSSCGQTGKIAPDQLPRTQESR